jgi:protein-disulfide isomerase-like protein with CxxC motif
MRTNRLFLLLVATMLVVGLSVSAIYAQDTEDGVACDVDLMLDLYIAEKFFGFSSFTNQMTADDIGFDLNNFDRGQFTPLFDDMDTRQTNLQFSSELRNHLTETMAMTDAEFDTHFNDEMLPEIGEMMDADFSTLTILPAAEGSADEANECAALRRTLRRFFMGLIYGEVEFGNITTQSTGAADTTTEPADTTTESTDTDTTTDTGTVAGAIGVNLSGAEEAPAPGDEDATGTAVVYLRTDNNEVCVDIVVQNIALPATAAHIHQAPRGQAGPPVVPLNAPGETGRSSTCVAVDPALMQEMMNNTSNFYVNVHNAEFPDGAARGQLVPGSAVTTTTTDTGSTNTDTANTDTTVSDGALTVNLSGAEEVPGPGDEDAAGTAVVYLRTDNNEVCVDIIVQNIAPATAAHIHQAVDGQSGPPVVPLNTPGENGLSSTCAVIDAALMQEMVNNPANFYVNVHNAEFPDGAARGQLGG